MGEYFTIDYLNLYLKIIIAIIGGSFTYIQYKKNIYLKKFEYKKDKLNSILDDCLKLIEEIEFIISGLSGLTEEDNKEEKIYEKLKKNESIISLKPEKDDYDTLKKKVYYNILNYGEKDSIKIVNEIESIYFNHRINKNKKENNYNEDNSQYNKLLIRRVLAANILLLFQIKYEVSGIKSNPEKFYIGNYWDTDRKSFITYEFFETITEQNNLLVDDLKLGKWLKIKK